MCFEEDDDMDKVVDDFLALEGTYAIGDLCQACQCIFEALELSEDRIVPPEIVSLLEEARDCLDRMLFYNKTQEQERDIDAFIEVDDGEPPF